MAKLGCVLLDASGLAGPEVLAGNLRSLRELLGPEPPLDVWWRGDALPDVPPGVRLLTQGSGARAVGAAAARAMASPGHLLVLLGNVLPDSSVVRALLESLDLDPLMGFAQPRYGDRACQGIWSLPGGAGSSPALLPRAILSMLPPHYITTERLSACLAIRREAVAGFAAPADASRDIVTTLFHELCLGRRRGFRNLVVNRAVVGSEQPHAELYPQLDASERALLESRFPDAAVADEWFT